MKPERKRLAQDLLGAVAIRVTIVDEMIDGTRPANAGDAKKYMNEIKKQIDKINGILDIS